MKITSERTIVVEEDDPKFLPYVHAPLKRIVLPEEGPGVDHFAPWVLEVHVLCDVRSAALHECQESYAALTAACWVVSKTRTSL